MATAATLPKPDPTRPPLPEYLPDCEQFVTEVDAPVSDFFSEKQQRLLTEPRYSTNVAMLLERPLLATVNVGIFFSENEPAIMPDVLLILDMQPAEDLWLTPNCSYFIWRFAKLPDVVVKIVSNRERGEADRKRACCTQPSIGYPTISDPRQLLRDAVMRCDKLCRRTATQCANEWPHDAVYAHNCGRREECMQHDCAGATRRENRSSPARNWWPGQTRAKDQSRYGRGTYVRYLRHRHA